MAVAPGREPAAALEDLRRHWPAARAVLQEQPAAATACPAVDLAALHTDLEAVELTAEQLDCLGQGGAAARARAALGAGLGRERARGLVGRVLRAAIRLRLPEPRRRRDVRDLSGLARRARVAHAFLPLLEGSDAPVVVNVSSRPGSLAATADPSRIEFHVALLDYNSSKTPLVMVTSQYAKAYPPSASTQSTPATPPRTSTAARAPGHQQRRRGAEIIVRMASIGAHGPSGGLFDQAGPVVW
ncbi:hypothetical protein [Streptomyces sp. NBC_00057]|uniref:hypothetical protein n=1 Tax=Streptomyces sp. NBC_00057 TaxID=2975634 RepID=UPI003255CA10